MFDNLREGIQETSTMEVKSLPGLRFLLTCTNKIELKCFDFKLIGPRSAELRLGQFNDKYFVDFAQILVFKFLAEVKKVVTNTFPLLCL